LGHTPEQDLELYLLGRLTERQTSHIARHLWKCDECAERLTAARAFVQQMRELSQELAAGAGPAEQRKHRRITTAEPAQLRVLEPAALEPERVQILDVTGEGLKIAVSQPLVSGALVQIRLADSVVVAEVRNCRHAGECYHAGIEVHDVFPSLER